MHKAMEVQRVLSVEVSYEPYVVTQIKGFPNFSPAPSIFFVC